MLKSILPLLVCAVALLSPTSLVTAGGHDRPRDHDHRIQVRGVITAIDYHAQQLTLTTVRGDERIRIPVQASDGTVIVEGDDHHTRLRFSDLKVGNHAMVGGRFRDHVLLARLIVRHR